MLKKQVKYRPIVLFILMTVLFTAAAWTILVNQIPDRLFVSEDTRRDNLLSTVFPGWISEETLEVGSYGKSNIPRDNLTVEEGASYTVQCSLMGIIPIKEIQVEVVDRQQVRPGGIPVGIYMKTEGVLIVGTGEVCDMDGISRQPLGDIVHSGDYIQAVNGVPVSNKEEVVEQINQAVNSKVNLQILREGETMELQVPVVQTGKSEYKAGIWIRDDTQGIGTLTYVKEDGTFGALGHGISDIDTSTLLSLEEGKLYETEIRSVVRGENGVPGELAGVIKYRQDKVLGNITENTEIGIFGRTEESITEQAPIEAAYKQEVEIGPAVLLSAVDGETKEYHIEIEKINLNSSDANKSMVIRVVDQELLNLTGGIVQGMSGSPIIQKGRIVGAVTHVFVNDPAKGYGVFIETMLEH